MSFIPIFWGMGSTIQDLIDEGAKLRANCGNPACMHSEEIDLFAMREKLGPMASVAHHALSHRLRCSRCKQKRAFITHHVDTTKPTGWVNPYIRVDESS